MVNVMYALVWLGAAWKWGDWRNWRKYYPTILFFVLGDFLYLLLLSDSFPMWRYNPPDIDEDIGVTNKIVSLSIIVIKYPATVLIYLSKFPRDKIQKQILYILCWVLIYLINEAVDLKFHLIQYFNGWSLGWSVLFTTVMFILLRVHLKNPLIALGFSIVFILFLWKTFDVPFSVFN